MMFARALILAAILVPRSWRAATQASATSAAATAYSESSNPDSSTQNFLSIRYLLMHPQDGSRVSVCYLIVLASALILPAMLVPSSWKAATQASATSAAATAYSESSRPVSSLKNFLSIRCLLLRTYVARARSSCRATFEIATYLMVLARVLILPAMLVPRSWKAATQAKATSAAATAYSESSRPVSSWKNLLIILLLLYNRLGLCLNEWTNEGGSH